LKLRDGFIEAYQKLLDLEATYKEVGQMPSASGNINLVARTAVERMEPNGFS